MRPPLAFVLRSLVGLLLLPLALTAQGSASVVFIHATVIDVVAGRAIPDTTLVVTGKRIAAIGPGGQTTPPAGARVIDATGKFLVPGFWDMHAHVGAGGSATEIDMPLLIANGVTGVREMWSDCPAVMPVDCLAERRAWQQQVDRGAVVGPRLLALGSWPVNGPAGPPGGFPHGTPEFFGAATEAQGRQLAQYFASRKVDFIKIYPRVPRSGFLGLADEARRLGLPLAGHEASAITAVEASNAGQRSFEHARVFLYTCFPGATDFSRTTGAPNHTWRRRMVDEYDPALCRPVFETFVRNGTRFVPTHLTRRIDTLASDPALRRDPHLMYVPKALETTWIASLETAAARYNSDASRQSVKDFYTKGLELTGAAHRSGVKILAGTDTGDTFVIAGFSLHDEMQELVKAGLSNAEVLKAATWNGAEFMGRTSDAGSLSPGKVADIVMLVENPLSRIGATTTIAGVMFDGRYMDRAALDAMLAGVKAAARR